MGNRFIFGLINYDSIMRRLSNLNSGLLFSFLFSVAAIIWHETRIEDLEAEIDILKEAKKEE